MARQRTATRAAASFAETFDGVVDNVERVIQGKHDVIRLALVCLVAEGHLLIEDVPGVGKTTLAKALATSVGGEYNRIQFTPDLLPTDVTGGMIYSRSTGAFEFRAGPVFATIVLGDEINRASPKTQSALLEAMEERQVTSDGTTYRLPVPFMVIATQNPHEHEGTYPLPESQLDRFLMRISMGYPERTAEISMLDAHGGDDPLDDLGPVATTRDLQHLVEAARAVHVDSRLKGYIVDVAEATRRHPSLALGASPRAALALQRAARARAASVGRDYVLPDDLKALAGPVLEHRLSIRAEAELGGSGPDAVLAEVLSSVPVPVARGR